MNTDTATEVAPITNEEWWQRDGPCTVVYRAIEWYEHPQYRAYSCLGCKHLRFSFEVHPGSQYSESYCAHPDFIKAYGCAQYNGGSRIHAAKRMMVFMQCPALRARGVFSHPEQPPKDLIPKKESPSFPRDVFKIPQPPR